MSGDEPPKCQACQGYCVTEPEQHTVEIDKDGNQIPVVRRWTGPSTTCHGTGLG
ncbi:hypothetical protein [Streptomyces sp. NPDC087300]|uniref:hypothetical protein n=1 Tax=Streptomyces sp. NPDC087300 TaxID=3365780 RepID=UPI00381A0692